MRKYIEKNNIFFLFLTEDIETNLESHVKIEIETELVDAKVAVRVSLHVKLEGQRWQEVDEEDPDGAGECAVVEAVCDVAPVVGQSSADVPVHASEGSRHAVGSPSCESFPGVRVVPEVGRHFVSNKCCVLGVDGLVV